jgi:hypothetical protein
VGSLFRPGTFKNRIQELKKYKINIATVQEMQWKGNDISDSDDYTICYSGSSNNIFGTWLSGSQKTKELYNGLCTSR